MAYTRTYKEKEKEKQMEINLPEDPIILLSFINLKLRDYYSSFDALCDDLNLDKELIQKKLSTVGYEYDSSLNRFQ